MNVVLAPSSSIVPSRIFALGLVAELPRLGKSYRRIFPQRPPVIDAVMLFSVPPILLAVALDFEVQAVSVEYGVIPFSVGLKPT